MGELENFRQRTDWLPRDDDIVLSVRETEHGLKVLYGDGHLLEYAVFSEDEIRLAKANDYAVAFDRGAITEAMAAIATHERIDETAIQRNIQLFLCLLVVGAGRVARGEKLSGQLFIRSRALAHLLAAIVKANLQIDFSKLDNLDVFRRFEQVFPELGNCLNDVLSREPIAVAEGLLAIFREQFQSVEGYPAMAVNTVRDVLARARS